MKKSPIILVIREFDKFSSLLAKNGFEIINLPLIQTLPIADFEKLNEKIENLKIYDGLFLTSPKAAEVFLQQCKNKGITFRGKIYVLGNRTKSAFENRNFEIVFRERANTAEEFINSFDKSEFAGKKFLFLSGDKSLRMIPELLKDAATVDEIVIYRTIENAIDENLKRRIGEKLAKNEIDWICFFSPSAIESFGKTFDGFSPNSIKVAVIGTTTAKKAAESKLKVEVVSSKATAADFAAELIGHLEKDFDKYSRK